MEKSLDQVKLGQQAVVLQIDTAQALKNRLKDFGFVCGTKVMCSYRSPGGKVTALSFRGIVVAVRTRELKNIYVRCIL